MLLLEKTAAAWCLFAPRTVLCNMTHDEHRPQTVAALGMAASASELHWIVAPFDIGIEGTVDWTAQVVHHPGAMGTCWRSGQ